MRKPPPDSPISLSHSPLTATAGRGEKTPSAADQPYRPRQDEERPSRRGVTMYEPITLPLFHPCSAERERLP